MGTRMIRPFLLAPLVSLVTGFSLVPMIFELDFFTAKPEGVNWDLPTFFLGK